MVVHGPTSTPPNPTMAVNVLKSDLLSLMLSARAEEDPNGHTYVLVPEYRIEGRQADLPPAVVLVADRAEGAHSIQHAVDDTPEVICNGPPEILNIG